MLFIIRKLLIPKYAQQRGSSPTSVGACIYLQNTLIRTKVLPETTKRSF